MELKDATNKELILELARRLTITNEQPTSTSNTQPKSISNAEHITIDPVPTLTVSPSSGYRKGMATEGQLSLMRKFNQGWCPDRLKLALSEINIQYTNLEEALPKLTFDMAKKAISRVTELNTQAKLK